MMSRSAKRRNGFDIFNFPADPPRPTPSRSVSRSRRPVSVRMPPTAKGKLTTAERLKMVRVQNANRLSLSQRRQRREREKAEAFRKILIRRKEDPDIVWDLTHDVPLGVQANQPSQADELVSDDDEDEPDFAPQRGEVRKLFSSPDRETPLSRPTERNLVRRSGSTDVTEVSDDEHVPTSRLKKRRVTEPRKRVGIPVTSSVFAPDVRTAIANRSDDHRKQGNGVQKRIPLETINGYRKASASQSKIARSRREENWQRELRRRRSECNRADNANPREIVLNGSTIQAYPEDIEEVHHISDDTQPLSARDVQEQRGFRGRTSLPGPPSQQALKRPRHGQHTEKTIPAKAFYQKNKNGSRSSFPPRHGHLVIPRLKTQKAEAVSKKIPQLNLHDQPPRPNGKVNRFQTGEPARRNQKGRLQYDSTDDEYESARIAEPDIRFRPLRKAELEVVRSLTFKVSKHKVMAKIPEANIELKAGDFSGLRGSRWLNDEIINSFVSLINARNKRQINFTFNGGSGQNEEKSEEDDEIMEVAVTSAKPMEVFRRPRPRTHVFNTFFFPRLSQHGYDYNGVRRWLKKARRSIMELDLILFPINLSNFHWVLAAIDLRGKQFLYLDSTYGKDSSSTIPLLRKWLHDEVADKHGENAAAEMQIDSWGSIVNPAYLPQQKDGGSCGIFTLYMAEYLERGRRPDFTQENIRTLRQRTALFLKRGKLPDT